MTTQHYMALILTASVVAFVGCRTASLPQRPTAHAMAAGGVTHAAPQGPRGSARGHGSGHSCHHRQGQAMHGSAAGHAQDHGGAPGNHQGALDMIHGAFRGPPVAGMRARCPVTGEVFTVTRDSPVAAYKDKHYALCCAGCKPRFEASPAKFAR